LSNKRFYSPEKKREEKNKRRKTKERKKRRREKEKRKGAVLCVSVLILEVCCDFPLYPGSRL
jgi:hypothetical protein